MSGVLYFAYGSNLSLRQMRARCPSAITEGRAGLTDHRLDFVQPHDGWGGGVAGIVSATGERVPGVVYRLSEDDLERLDGFEPVDSARYQRIEVAVQTEIGDARLCWTYVGRVFPEAPYTPSSRYLETLIEGAREHGLEPSYIADLERRRPGR